MSGFSMKQHRCPRCGAAKTLNRHSILYGKDPSIPAGRCVRGQRVFCCNRGRRGGCGGTFSVFLGNVLPRHTVTAPLLWQMLCRLLTESSVKAGVEGLRAPFALETMYHVLKRLRSRLPHLLSQLGGQYQLSEGGQRDPLLQGIERLRSIISQEGCPLVQFQLQFQSSLMG